MLKIKKYSQVTLPFSIFSDSIHGHSLREL